MIRQYEALYIVHPDLTDDEIAPITEKYKNVVEEQGGEVEGINRWEKRRLAYEVKGQKEGIYVLMNFSGDAKVKNEVDRMLRIGDDTIRHIIVRCDEMRVDEVPAEEKPVKQVEKAAEEKPEETTEGKTEETAVETSEETPAETPQETSEETTEGKTEEAAVETSEETPAETPQEASEEAADETEDQKEE